VAGCSSIWRSTSVLLATVLLFGCAKQTEGEGPAANAEAAIGIPECDEYVKKMEAFLDSLPDDARKIREPGFTAMRAAWRDTAKTPEGKDSLAGTCKAQLATLPAEK